MKGTRLFFRSMSLMAAIGIRATPKWMSVSAVCQIISAVNAAVFAYGLRLVVDSAIHHRVPELFVVGVAMGSLYGFGYAAGYLRITTSYTVLNRADLYLVEEIARLGHTVPGIEHF